MESVPKNEYENLSQEEIFDKLVAFVSSEKMSGDDLRTAYLLSLDVSADEVGYEVNPKIEELAEKIKMSFDNGLPLNNVVDIIFSREEYESSIDKYNELVNKLNLTDKEKKILVSIVEKKREGVLSILVNKSSTKIDEVEIKNATSFSNEDLALDLREFLTRLEGFGGLAIEFSS